MAEKKEEEKVATPCEEATSTPLEFEVQEVKTGCKKQETWDNSVQFVLASVSICFIYATWRFHYQMYRHGGLPFLFAYILFVLLIAVPVFYLETCLGQFWGKGPFHIWRFCPIFRGVGLAQVLFTAMIYIYTQTHQAQFLYYTFTSLSSHLPWATCDNAWNSPYCATNTANVSLNYGFPSPSPQIDYYEREVLALQGSNGIGDLGGIRWKMVGCLVAITVLLFASVCIGVRVFGKILYVTCGMTLLILVVLFIRAVTLPGAAEGLQYLFKPDWTRAINVEFWQGALMEAAYSVAMFDGITHSLASYNRFNASSLRISYIVGIAVICLNLFVAMVIMSLNGAHAWMKGVDINSVIESGGAMVFVSIPGILSALPSANFWCFIFFFMFFLAGLTEKILVLDVLVKTAMDFIAQRKLVTRIIVSAVTCAVTMILSLPFFTQGGVYLTTLMDWYMFKYAPFAICVFECATVTWIYGLDQFSADIKMMTGTRPPIIFKFLWAIVIPVLFSLVYLVVQASWSDPMYKEYVFPEWTLHIGNFIAQIPLYAIPVCAIVRLCRSFRESPIDPDKDARPATDNWAEYDAGQRRMERSVSNNFRAICRS